MRRKRELSPSSSTLTEEGLCVKAKKVRVEAKEISIPTLLSSSSSPPSQRLSLTKDNLRKFNQITMQTTPEKKKTTRSAKETASTTDGQSVRGVRTLLRRNNLIIKDLKAEERGKDLIQKAQEIVKGARQSAMKTPTANELQFLANKHATDNELTFLVNVWKHLLGDTRQARPEFEVIEDDGEAAKWLETAWTNDYLKCNWSADFAPNSIPPLTVPDDDPALKDLANDIPRLGNPKPDLAYGLEEEAFTKMEQMLNAQYGARLSPNLYHPFFIVEAKSCSGPIEEAENQCARAGCAMVSLTRQFNALAEKAGSDDNHEQQQQTNESAEQDIRDKGQNHQRPSASSIGPSSSNNPNHSTTNSQAPSFADETSFSFSLAIVPTKAHLFVNWAEVTPNAKAPTQPPYILWQMNTIESYDLEKQAAWPELRRDLDNVLDWGTLTRKRQLQETCARMTQGGNKAKRQKRA